MKKLYLTIIAMAIAFAWACKKDDKETSPAPSTPEPKVKTESITETNVFSIACKCVILGEGDDGITEQGLILSLDKNIAVDDIVYQDSSMKDTFEIKIKGLNENTTYYVAAYAENSHGTSYGEAIEAKTLPIPETITDYDGNVYHTTKIGNQVWTVENLKVSHYNNGDPIPEITDDNEWANATSGAFCYYQNDPSYNNDFGKLYNIYTTLDERGICPEGWRIPDINDMEELHSISGINGTSLKSDDSTYWGVYAGTNEFGFNALPSDARDKDGPFYNENAGRYWLYDPEQTYYINSFRISFSDQLNYPNSSATFGLSVRMILEE
jgi:uncharacterized protein (TIGR02145 family)